MTLAHKAEITPDQTVREPSNAVDIKILVDDGRAGQTPEYEDSAICEATTKRTTNRNGGGH